MHMILLNYSGNWSQYKGDLVSRKTSPHTFLKSYFLEFPNRGSRSSKNFNIALNSLSRSTLVSNTSGVKKGKLGMALNDNPGIAFKSSSVLIFGTLFSLRISSSMLAICFNSSSMRKSSLRRKAADSSIFLRRKAADSFSSHSILSDSLTGVWYICSSSWVQ